MSIKSSSSDRNRAIRPLLCVTFALLIFAGEASAQERYNPERRAAWLIELGGVVNGCAISPWPLIGAGISGDIFLDSSIVRAVRPGLRWKLSLGYSYVHLEAALKIKFRSIYCIGGVQFGQTTNSLGSEDGTLITQGNTFVDAINFGIGFEPGAFFIELQEQYLPARRTCGSRTRFGTMNTWPENSFGNIVMIFGFRF